MELAELYPDGRYLYCEDDDPTAFIANMAKMGIEISIIATVPADKLDAFYALGHRIGS